jgi:hypothetical protein
MKWSRNSKYSMNIESTILSHVCSHIFYRRMSLHSDYVTDIAWVRSSATTDTMDEVDMIYSVSTDKCLQRKIIDF